MSTGTSAIKRTVKFLHGTITVDEDIYQRHCPGVRDVCLSTACDLLKDQFDRDDSMKAPEDRWSAVAFRETQRLLELLNTEPANP